MRRTGIRATAIGGVLCAACAHAEIVGVEVTSVDFSEGYVNFDGTINPNHAAEVAAAWETFDQEWDVYRLWIVVNDPLVQDASVFGSVDLDVFFVLDPGAGGTFYNDVLESKLTPPVIAAFALSPTLAFDTFVSAGPSEFDATSVNIFNGPALGGLQTSVVENEIAIQSTWGEAGAYVATDARGTHRILMGQFAVQEGSEFSGQGQFSAGNTFNFIAAFGPNGGAPIGACCLTDTDCIITNAFECLELGGAYEGAGAICFVAPCQPPPGACCLPSGCANLSASVCDELDGVHFGNGSSCDDGDSDGDGVPDACDGCPMDSDKFSPGVCGCGNEDDLSGAAVTASFGAHGTQVGGVLASTGMTVDVAGRVYTVDPELRRITIYEADGTLVGAGVSGGPNSTLFRPVDIAATAARLFVVDQDNDRISVRMLDGEIDFVFGVTGSGPGEFMAPTGVAVSPDGDVYVSDAGNERIQVFSLTGVYQREFSLPQSGLGSVLFTPRGLTADRFDRVLIADTFNHRIVMMTSDGAVVRTIGTFGSGEGELKVPTDVTTDFAGRIFVADAGNDRVSVFSRDGDFLFALGSSGDEQGAFNSMQSVAATPTGRVYVLDTGNHRVQIVDVPMPEPCVADVLPDNGDGPRGNGRVNIDDVLGVILAFGSADSVFDIAPDNGDGTMGNGVVNVDDLVDVLNAFGPCPGCAP
ncbi:MAG: 6-bladed beta-propeller [Planctomycetota bacterium]